MTRYLIPDLNLSSNECIANHRLIISFVQSQYIKKDIYILSNWQYSYIGFLIYAVRIIIVGKVK